MSGSTHLQGSCVLYSALLVLPTKSTWFFCRDRRGEAGRWRAVAAAAALRTGLRLACPAAPLITHPSLTVRATTVNWFLRWWAYACHSHATSPSGSKRLGK